MDLNLRLQPKQAEAFLSPATEILYGGAAGGGKALAINTEIPTPDGWKTMLEISVGDVVFDENGRQCNVVAVTDVQYNRPCYKITFNDESEIIADAEHEWVTFNDSERSKLLRLTDSYRERRKKIRLKRGTGKRPDVALKNSLKKHEYLDIPTGTIRTTQELHDTLTTRNRLNHSIQLCKPIENQEAELPIDPYVLGAWLGDGTSSGCGITNADIEIVSEIEKHFVVKKRKAKYGYGIIGIHPFLKENNLLNNKHIPEIYLRASISQRLALLQGLMDTDGTCLPSGSCEFYSCDKDLIYQVSELVISLGIKAHVRAGRATLQGKDCGEKYRIKFTTEIEVFRLKRKLERQSKVTRKNTKHRMITNIESVESVPVKCIQVDSESNLYLASRSMIPTHNSHLMRVAAITWCMEIPGLMVYIFRRTYPELWKNHVEGPTGFPALLGPLVQAKYAKVNYSDAKITFWNGSTIFLCHCQHENTVINYQGAEIHVLMIDELGQWLRGMYAYLRGRLRISGITVPEKYEGMFPRILCSANPGGIGHNWLKQSWIDLGPGIHKMPKHEGGKLRTFIPAYLTDNRMLNDDYADVLSGLGNESLVKALLEGNWDIVSGGAFDDVWDRQKHVIKPFPIPSSWYINRSFDWGGSKPFSVGWWAESDGTTALVDGKEKSWPRGTLFRIGEWYGWNGKSNEGLKLEDTDIGKGMKEREEDLRKYLNISQQIRPGPADSSIFDADPGKASIAKGIEKGYGRTGLFTHADKSPGSRKNRLAVARRLLKASLAERMEEPGVFIFNTCNDGFIRTVPVLPRDERNPDDVDTHAEDHAYDDFGYRITEPRHSSGSLLLGA